MSGEPSERAAPAIRLRDALDATAGLPLADIEQVNVLIDAGELQVALETLCTQAYEYDIEISSALGDTLLNLGTILEVPVGYLLGDPWAHAPNETK